jgi:hypothetical protein
VKKGTLPWSRGGASPSALANEKLLEQKAARPCLFGAEDHGLITSQAGTTAQPTMGTRGNEWVQVFVPARVVPRICQ